MPTWFSDHYTTAGLDESSLPTLRSAADATVQIKHSRMRHSMAIISVTDGAAADVFRMMTLRSSDRIIEMNWLSDGGFVAEAVADLGCYKSGDAHDGAILDADLFDTAVDISSATGYTAVFNDGILTEEDRGKQLWELVVVGADPDSWTEDPKINIDLTLLMVSEPTAGLGLFKLFVKYLAGD